MPREAWMLPREEMIGRNLEPDQDGSRRPSSRQGDAKRASALLACVAVVAALVSGAVVLSMDGSQETGTSGPDTPGAATPLIPPLPFFVKGYTIDGSSDPLPYCTVTITNDNTDEFAVVESDGVGYYAFDVMNGLPSGVADNDLILVLAVNDSLQLMGENQGNVDMSVLPPALTLDITLDVVIPEFSMLIVPVTGVMAMFVAMGIRRRKRQ